METERRIFRSTTILFTANLISQLASFGFVVLFARSYSPALFGEYSFALALGSLLAVFVSMGTNQLLLRNCSRDLSQWQPHAGVLFPGRLPVLALMLSLSIGIAAMLGVSGMELRIVAIVALFQLLNPVWALFSVGFTATERMGYSAIANAGGRLLILLGGGLAILQNVRVDLMMLIFPVSSLLTLFVLLRISSAEFGRPDFRFDLAQYVAIVREALPFFGILAIAVVYGRTGILLLRTYTTGDEVGLFASAERLVMVAGMLHVTFAQAIFPAMVRLQVDDTDEFHQLVNRCVRLILLLTLPVATVLFLFAADLIQMLFGNQFADATGILRMVSWLIAMRGITAVLNNIGTASDRQRLVFISGLAGTLVLIICCVALIPDYGAAGLAAAALVGQSVKSIAIYVLLRPSGLLPDLFRVGVPVAGACFATLVVSATLPEMSFGIRASGVLVAGTALLFLFRAIRVEDLIFFHKILTSRQARTPKPAGRGQPDHSDV